MTKNKFFTYKGKPLVRCGDELYYGSMADPFVIRLAIKSKEEINGLETATKVSVQLLSTDQDLSPRRRIIKSSEKPGLYAAIDIADIWLERALSGKG